MFGINFIDFEKASDKVRHENLYKILKDNNVDGGDINTITQLYWNQRPRNKVDNEQTEEMKICQGVRRGCVLSPLLFHLYSEAVVQETLLEQDY